MNSESAEDGQNAATLDVAAGQSCMLLSLSNRWTHRDSVQAVQELNQGRETNCFVRHKLVFDPPRRQYGSLADAFDYLNRTLFSGGLPQALLTLNHGPTRVKGYYRHNGFSFRGGPWAGGLQKREHTCGRGRYI